MKPAQASADTQAELDQIASMRHGVWIATFVGFLIAIVAWPLLMMPAGGVWSLGYFRFYVVITFIMIFIATIIGTFLPLWEGRHIFYKVSEKRHWSHIRSTWVLKPYLSLVCINVSPW